ncbi:hypothetical protein FACS189443_2170 [Planctomycetales bacterium]|nr:hypothetical protein FACS189443_2170 [Planctomycetales bacterium]
MFKIIVLKSQYNLSDEMTGFFIRDRKTFQDFPGITPYHTIPDAKTIWLFAEQMRNAQLKQGEIPQEFKSNPHRLAQKDC